VEHAVIIRGFVRQSSPSVWPEEVADAAGEGSSHKINNISKAEGLITRQTVLHGSSLACRNLLADIQDSVCCTEHW
jgi:hypothetical protein